MLLPVSRSLPIVEHDLPIVEARSLGHSSTIMIRQFIWLSIVLWALFAPQHASADDTCSAPATVCAARASVFVISAFDPFASAVRISPTRLVANRHAVADRATVSVLRRDGSKVTANVVPSAYDSDLILIETADLDPGPVLPIADEIGDGVALYTVGGDVGRGEVRVYPPGGLLLKPDAGSPYGRLHHTAYTQPGNSGGALVDGDGRLVGIVASGGEGRFEAIPVREIERLKQLSGPEFAAQSAKLGAATRQCVELLEAPVQGPLSNARADDIHATCSSTANRQFFDLAARTLGQARRIDLALDLSNRALARDANALNSRLILLTILHIARRYEEELPHIVFLLKHLPDEQMVHRFAIQAGKWTGDMDLARTGLELVRKHNPAQAKAAEQFLNADIPRPKPLQ